MSYVEWLRVCNVLRVLGIVLGILVLASLALRIGFAGYLNDDSKFLSHIQMQHGAVVSHVVLSNGVAQTIIDDPADKTHVTIDNLGYGGRHIVITEPSSGSHTHDHIIIGSVRVFETQHEHGDVSTTVIDTNSAVPFAYYMAAAVLMSLLVATILGAPFARENDGHLETALMRPASRLELGLRTMGVDAVGILAAAAMTIVALIICQAMFEVPHFDFSGVNSQSVIVGIILPLAWYAMLSAASSSLKRGYGAVIGFAWPVAILVLVFSKIPLGSSLLAGAVHEIFWIVSRIDPLSYISISAQPALDNLPSISPDFGSRITFETILLLVYVALALYQWQRVEA
ncbi:MAG: hypothetical protein M3R51_08110 [Candidatus Eremiobacteraeota bacterium]|nr:hypothetical protein [Candidatus Eremiobacteraeota bacterium]